MTPYQAPTTSENVSSDNAKKPQCRIRDHRWRPVRGSAREVCTECATSFPCRRACGHLDCLEATGRELPEWIVEVKS